ELARERRHRLEEAEQLDVFLAVERALASVVGLEVEDVAHALSEERIEEHRAAHRSMIGEALEIDLALDLHLAIAQVAPQVVRARADGEGHRALVIRRRREVVAPRHRLAELEPERHARILAQSPWGHPTPRAR